MGHYLAIFVLWAAVMSLSLQLQLSEQEMKDMKGKFCGSHLSDMLSVLCGGYYHTGSRQKRSNMYNRNELNNREDYQDIEPIEYSDEPMLSFPFRSKIRAKSIMPLEFRKRGSHGVASECCHKSCSLWEMASYCGKQ